MTEKLTFEQSVVQGQLIMGKQVMDMYFELEQNKWLKGSTQELDISGTDYVLELRRADK